MDNTTTRPITGHVGCDGLNIVTLTEDLPEYT